MSDQATKSKPSRRKSIVAKARHQDNLDRVVALREGNVPFRTIARTLGIPEKTCREHANEAYRKALALDGMSTEQRLFERKVQLEILDARAMRVVSAGPDAATLAAHGYEYQDWVKAAELSRKLKGDLVALEGLAKSSGDRTPAGVADATPPQTLKELRSEAVQEFLIKMLEGTPPEFRRAVQARLGEMFGGVVQDAFGEPAESPRVIGGGSGGVGYPEPPNDIPISGGADEPAGG